MQTFIKEKIKYWHTDLRDAFFEKAAVFESSGRYTRDRAEIEAFRRVAPEVDKKGMHLDVVEPTLFELPEPVREEVWW